MSTPESGRIPLATYRLQIHHAFPLTDATRVVPYLARLGVTHAYSSPLLKARSGSVHGYDVVDPAEIDPQVGDEEILGSFARALHDSGLGLLLDIVPNHMAIGRQNPYWSDVLAYGRGSPYARWFDVDWDGGSGSLRGRVVLPNLGEPVDDALRDGKLKLALDDGSIRVAYGDERFPLDPATLADVLAHRLEDVRSDRGASSDAIRELDEIIDELASLPRRWEVDDASVHERRERAESAVDRLALLLRESGAARAHLEVAVRDFGSGTDGVERMRTLLGLQVYHLIYWREGLRRINYRRFFDIAELIGVRVGHPEVFAATHARILGWVSDGTLDGVRVDHVDGLRDPAGYLRQLQTAMRTSGGTERPLIFVEKILSEGERLRESWPVTGTTGYDFLNDAESLFVAGAGRDALHGLYARLAGSLTRRPDFETVALECKRRILITALRPDLERVLRLLARIAPAAAPAIDERAEAPFDARVPSIETLRVTLTAIAAALPVYRTYFGSEASPHPADIEVLDRAVAVARRRFRVPRHAAELVRHVLVGSPATANEPATRDSWREFTERFQQLSGPAAAKGIEDTALYRAVSLVSLCEVGGTPDRPLDDAVNRFHRTNEHRAILWPMTMLAATTHDTKRSADVRSRLDVLSEMPDRWIEATRRWRRRYRSHAMRIDRRTAPDAVTEYLLYQSVLGIWPLGDGDDERVHEYMLKAAREGKSRTSWLDPNEAFERALRRFVESVLADEQFRAEMADIARDVIPAGYWNALSRAVLQFGSPGIPDLYQGDEMWNFSLVDPDNRRPVDYARREAALTEMEERETAGPDQMSALAKTLLRDADDGRFKLLTVHRALQARRAHPRLFVGGSYRACRAAGAAADHVIAFERVAGPSRALIIAPRYAWTLCGGTPPIGSCWTDTTIEAAEARDWRCAFTGRVLRAGSTIRMADALGAIPVGLFISSPDAAPVDRARDRGR